MKNKKKNAAKLGKSKRRQFKNSKNKEMTMYNIDAEIYEDSIEEMEESNDIPDENIIRRPPGTKGTKVGKPRGPDWSPEEIEYIIQTCQSTPKVTHELFNEIASMLNKHVYKNEQIRSGSGIWWMLKRGQEKGKYKTITIPGGAPKASVAKATKNIIPPVAESRMNVRGAVDKAIAPTKSPARRPTVQPVIPVIPQPAQRVIQKPQQVKSKPGGFYVVVENSDGKVVKIQTKFNNYEEFIFAVT